MKKFDSTFTQFLRLADLFLFNLFVLCSFELLLIGQ